MSFKPSIAIIDYGSGNLRSVYKAFERVLKDHEVNADLAFITQKEDLKQASHIVLPGVGAFADCAHGLQSLEGMWDGLNEAVMHQGKPFLGICVGMQLMAKAGHEHQICEGFGWLDGDVKPIQPQDPLLKIPHMGWNMLKQHQPHPLLKGILLGDKGLHAYFVHSYAMTLSPSAQETIIASCDYGGDIAAFVGRDNIAGTQFHPEKSQTLGLSLIHNFIKWRP